MFKAFFLSAFAIALVIVIALAFKNNNDEWKKISVSEAKVGTETASAYVPHVCPACGEDSNCIYQMIEDTVVGEGTDQEIYDAVIAVCHRLKITDQKTINILLNEYQVN